MGEALRKNVNLQIVSAIFWLIALICFLICIVQVWWILPLQSPSLSSLGIINTFGFIGTAFTISGTLIALKNLD